ncbi:MAG: methylated-DNA--[protein]-cysteine S-methyltransferase [Burkholderiaceae bacterium]
MQAVGVRSEVFGDVAVIAHQGAVVGLQWREPAARLVAPDGNADTAAVLREAASQMTAYFDKRLNRFDLPLSPRGTRFQQQVYQALQDIPTGQTLTYGEMAAQLGNAAQAVGNACGSNPIAIIIPCHRVLGTNGAGGFSAPGGIEVKIALLRHENAWPYLL